MSVSYSTLLMFVFVFTSIIPDLLYSPDVTDGLDD